MTIRRKRNYPATNDEYTNIAAHLFVWGIVLMVVAELWSWAVHGKLI